MELTEDQLLAMAQEADNSAGLGEPDQTPIVPDGAATETPKQETAEPPKTEQPPTTQSKPDPKSSSEAPAEQKPEAVSDEDDSKLSPYERQKRKAAKEWERVNKTKEELARRERELAEREAKLNQPPPKTDPNAELKQKYTIEDFEGAAAECEEQGKKAEARRFQQIAAEMREEASKQDAEKQQQEYLNTWTKHRDETIAKIPELQNDTPLTKEVMALLHSEELFRLVPDGFPKAVEVAKLRLSAARVPGLEEEVTKLKAEVDRLNKATSIGGSNPTVPPPNKSLDQMSEAEADAHFLQLAADHDRAAFG